MDWLAIYSPNGLEPLFVPILKSGALPVRQMSAQSVYDMLKKRAD